MCSCPEVFCVRGGYEHSHKSTCTLVLFQQRAAFLTAWWVDALIARLAVRGNSEVASKAIQKGGDAPNGIAACKHEREIAVSLKERSRNSCPFGRK